WQRCGGDGFLLQPRHRVPFAKHSRWSERRSGIRSPPSDRRGSRRKFDSPMRNSTWVIAGYESGLTLNELATAFGADHRTLANRLEGRDIPRRGPRLSYEQLQEAIALYGRGWSLSRAERFGVYPLSIRYRLQRSGVKLRPRPGWSSKST